MRIVRVALSLPPDVTGVHSHDPVYAILEDDEQLRVLTKAPWLGGVLTDDSYQLDREWLLPPVTPSKILCIGRNYAAHAKELGHDVPKEPLLFLKPPSSLIGPGQAIVLPAESARVEHEAELAVVIGRRCKSVPRERALDYVFGFTCAGDITARDLQRSDGQWSRAKGFDTFCPVGPWIETDIDPADVRVSCSVNGTVRQDGNTRDMIFPVEELVAYASRMMTLEPGDLLLTGTPEGVGPLLHGDRLEITIFGIGTLSCDVENPTVIL
jgi:2-keto-4-pentenoate hydratase/2-oxohepta-3-ene-1,7-dioic acid hydratase in catechol pathway